MRAVSHACTLESYPYPYPIATTPINPLEHIPIIRAQVTHLDLFKFRHIRHMALIPALVLNETCSKI